MTGPPETTPRPAPPLGAAPAPATGAVALADGVHRRAPTLPGPPGAPARAPWRPRRIGLGRWLPALASAVAVVGVMVVVLWQMHPSLLFSNTSTTGGDTGAHYMMPAYFTSDLFPHLTGWDPAWYAGYPIYTFYFVLPDALVAIFSHVITYNVAFKLATVLGSLLMPLTAYACGRLFRLRPPVPAALAAATLPFLFDYSYTIYGGNLFSTLAGEYAYSLSVALALLFLGLFARGLRTGRYRVPAAVVLAACILAHIVPAVLALAGAGLLTVFELLPERFRLSDERGRPSAPVARPPGRLGVRPWRQALWWGVSTVALGVGLSGWWLVPFGLDAHYTTAMGYSNVTTYFSLFLPVADRWALVLAGIAVVLALVMRSRFGILFSILGAGSALGLVIDPQGSLYNVRLLPLWFLCVFLMAGWLTGQVLAAVALWWRRARLAHWTLLARLPGPAGRLPRRPRAPRWEPAAVLGPLVALLGALAVVVPPFISPLADALPHLGIHPGANEVSAWATWNYEGYEGAPGADEYFGLMRTMRQVGAKYGCGRAMWEYNANENRFGTPEALMLLPYWTGGCIDSMEGLLFESSTTTPFHFLNQAELSPEPSDPMVGLPYGPLDVPLGVEHLQLMGVRYFMAVSPQVQGEAAADPALHLVATSGPYHSTYPDTPSQLTWKIYEIADSPLVAPLTHQPAVLQGVSPKQADWLGQVGPEGQPVDGPSVAWYLDPSEWSVELAAGGPASWPRVTATTWRSARRVPVSSTRVTDVVSTDDSISFHVSRTGTPVLVKISYFPNWQASGAQGPWRATPNFMVVVPTSHQVTLRYGATAANDLGLLISVVSAAILVGCLLVPWGLRRLARRRPEGLGRLGRLAGLERRQSPPGALR